MESVRIKSHQFEDPFTGKVTGVGFEAINRDGDVIAAMSGPNMADWLKKNRLSYVPGTQGIFARKD